MEKDHLEIILESIDSKFQLVLEGHSSLANQIAAVDRKLTERADLTDFKIEILNDKIDAVAADLKAHRADTEAHGNAGLYVVKEG
jgi:hypothetical protein